MEDDNKDDIYIGQDLNDMNHHDQEPHIVFGSPSIDAQVKKVDKDDKEWTMHGRPVNDDKFAEETHAWLSSNANSCKLNNSLVIQLALLFISIIVFHGTALVSNT